MLLGALAGVGMLVRRRRLSLSPTDFSQRRRQRYHPVLVSFWYPMGTTQNHVEMLKHNAAMEGLAMP